MKPTPSDASPRPRLAELFASHRFHLAVVAVLASVLLFSSLHRGGLSGYDDAFYAHEGERMLASGDWWNVRYNGHLNFEYPPMFMWLEALSFSALGANDFAAKFPSALAGLLTILLTFLIARGLSDEFWLPIAAAWVLMLTQYFLKYAMHAMTDVPFTFFFTLALHLYVRALRRPDFFLPCGAAVGAAILTRSVLGLIPLGVISAHLLLAGRWRLLFSWRAFAGLLLALALPAVWYLSQYQLHGDEFLRGHFSFITSKAEGGPVSHGRGPLRDMVEYPWLLLRLYWPWLPLMLAGLFIEARRAARGGDPAALLPLVWVAMVVAPLSFVEAKVLRYIMPVFPALAILSAVALVRVARAFVRPALRPAAYAAACAAVLVIALLAKPELRAEDMRRLGPLANEHARPGERVVIYTGGDVQYKYVNQFLWYSDRFALISVDPGQLERSRGLNDIVAFFLDPLPLAERLRAPGGGVFIVDAPTFGQTILNSGVGVEVVGRTENFVLFKTAG